MIIILLIIFGAICYSMGRFHQADECADQILGYKCRRYYDICDHSEIGVLKAKLAIAESRERDRQNGIQ